MKRFLLCLLMVLACMWAANLSTSALADAPGPNVSPRGAITDFDSQVASLKSQLGLAQLMNTTVSNHEPYSQWYTGKGLLSATTADLDGDGAKELLVVYISEGGSSGRRLNLRIYAARKGSIVSLGDVMLDEYFADDDAAIEIALVKKGKSTFIFYQGLLGAEPIWSGYFVFELKNDKLGSVCALRDAPYTAVTILEKMSNVSSVSTLSSFYIRSLSGTLLFRIDGRDNVSGKYKSYRSAVVSELSAFGLASFTTDYKPRMKATSNVTRICTIRSDVNSATKATIAVADFTGLQGPPITNPDANTIAVKSVTLNKTKGTITAGASGRLKATIKPANATDKTLVWSSDNEAVATVDQDGNVTGIGKGTTYIRVKTANGKTAKCKLTVKLPKVTHLSFVERQYHISEPTRLIYALLPQNADTSKLSFISSNKKVVTVDKNGMITPVGRGKATITATCDRLKAKCEVTIGDYRALVVVATTNDTDRQPFRNSGSAVVRMLNLQNYNGVKFRTVQALGLNEERLTRANVSDAVQKAFAGSSKFDMLLFYYIGHGLDTIEPDIPAGTLSMGFGNRITPHELQQMLVPLNGTKTVILNSCFSGAVIGKNALAAAEFHNAWRSALVDLVMKNGELAVSPFNVVTSCSSSQESLFKTSDGQYCFFTRALC